MLLTLFVFPVDHPRPGVTKALSATISGIVGLSIVSMRDRRGDGALRLFDRAPGSTLAARSADPRYRDLRATEHRRVLIVGIGIGSRAMAPFDPAHEDVGHKIPIGGGVFSSLAFPLENRAV